MRKSGFIGQIGCCQMFPKAKRGTSSWHVQLRLLSKSFAVATIPRDPCRGQSCSACAFPNGFVCPGCGCVEYYPVHGRSIYQCRSCLAPDFCYRRDGYAPYPFASDALWFWAIYLCATDKRGISAVQLPHTGDLLYPRGTYWIEFVPLWVKETKPTLLFRHCRVG